MKYLYLALFYLSILLPFTTQAQEGLKQKLLESERLWAQGDLAGCEQVLLSCAALVQETPDTSEYRLLWYETELYLAFSLSDYDRAIRANAAALQVSEIRQDSSSISTYHNNFGVLYGIKNDIDRSIKHYYKALQIYNSQSAEGERHNQALCHYNLGVAFYSKHEHQQALPHYYQALNLLAAFSEEEIREDLISIHQGLAEAHQKLGQIDSSFYYLHKNKRLHLYSDYEKDGTLESYGLGYFRQNELDKAYSYFQQSLDLRLAQYGEQHPWVAKSWYWLALCEYSMQQPQKAAQYAQAGLCALDPQLQDDDWQTNPTIERVTDLPKLIDLLHIKTQALSKLGDKYLLAAQRCSQLALAGIDSLRLDFQAEGSKRLLLTQTKEVLEAALDVTYRLYEQQPSERYAQMAFRIMERGKAALLREALSKSKASHFGGVPTNLLDEERQIELNIAFYKQMRLLAHQRKQPQQKKLYQNYLIDAQFVLDSLRQTIEQRYPRYYRLKYQEQLAVLADLQAHLDKNSLLQTFFEGDASVYSICIHKEGLWFTRHILPQDYANKMHDLEYCITDLEYVANFTAEAYQLFTKRSFEIYDWLLRENLERAPAAVNRLILIPDGQLSYLPFELLLPQKAPQNNFRFQDLPYLLYKYAISYDYSATLWLENQGKGAQTRGSKTLLALANSAAVDSSYKHPRYRNLQELPGVIDEVNGLKSYFNGTFWFNQEATEEALRREIGAYKILHFAMHGLTNKEQPAYSNLVLSLDKDNLQDGYLYAYEIQQLKLQAQLVVLSACQTGYGQYQAGEGLMSLGRSFMYAGTPSLILSMWQVSDQTSTALMLDFYQQLAEGLPKDKALQQAKIRYLQQSNMLTGHPFYWASFVQFGARAVIELPQKDSFPWAWVLTGVGLLALALFSWWKVVGFGGGRQVKP